MWWFLHFRVSFSPWILAVASRLLMLFARLNLHVVAIDLILDIAVIRLILVERILDSKYPAIVLLLLLSELLG